MNTLDNQTLLEHTQELRLWIEEAYEQYQKGKAEEEYPVYDFHTEIQPAVETFDQKMEEWLTAAISFIHLTKPRYLHEGQLEAVKENGKEVVLQSYFGKQHAPRVKNLVESVIYTLNLLIEEINKRS
ncbi:YppE family protein [Bacillus altitudinis]|uniref:YppE family protein n=1 Tax=Bacillus pumilus TaxID=1408 RepID=UPI0025A094D2|nr:YppE family protein [Bacillus pumilus]MDM5320395.1 YppE family protein [Bacillus pumilus]MDR4996243.1 YppE family protein [Bacillus altitudinis]